nr:hypothetical protein [uncultured bacterium]
MMGCVPVERVINQSIERTETRLRPQSPIDINLADQAQTPGRILIVFWGGRLHSYCFAWP